MANAMHVLIRVCVYDPPSTQHQQLLACPYLLLLKRICICTDKKKGRREGGNSSHRMQLYHIETHVNCWPIHVYILTFSTPVHEIHSYMYIGWVTWSMCPTTIRRHSYHGYKSLTKHATTIAGPESKGYLNPSLDSHPYSQFDLLFVFLPSAGEFKLTHSPTTFMLNQMLYRRRVFSQEAERDMLGNIVQHVQGCYLVSCSWHRCKIMQY